MIPEQIAPKGAIRSGFILFAIKASKVHKQMRKQTTFFMNGGKGLMIYLAECKYCMSHCYLRYVSLDYSIQEKGITIKLFCVPLPPLFIFY